MSPWPCDGVSPMSSTTFNINVAHITLLGSRQSMSSKILSMLTNQSYQLVFCLQRICATTKSWGILFPELLYNSSSGSSVYYRLLRGLRLMWCRWWCWLPRRLWCRRHSLGECTHYGAKLLGKCGSIAIDWGYWGCSFLFFFSTSRCYSLESNVIKEIKDGKEREQ